MVQLDCIWLTIQSQSEKQKPDRRKRRRKERKGQRVVVLVALGFWNDGSGRREILDWEIAKSTRGGKSCSIGGWRARSETRAGIADGGAR